MRGGENPEGVRVEYSCKKGIQVRWLRKRNLGKNNRSITVLD
jgi:hypothetical protein